MENKLENYAFIDSQNLYLSIKAQGWKIDFAKFRVYLRDCDKLEAVVIPDQNRYSALLKKVNTSSKKFLVFVSAVRNKVERLK